MTTTSARRYWRSSRCRDYISAHRTSTSAPFDLVAFGATQPRTPETVCKSA
jgi:hypothetical protein